MSYDGPSNSRSRLTIASVSLRTFLDTPSIPPRYHLDTTSTSPYNKGFTLTEVLVTVGLVAVILAVYTITLASAISLRRSQHYAQAANFIQEEIDTLRSLPFDELLTRTSGRFLGVTLPRGEWLVQNDPLDGQGRRLKLTAAQTAIIDETGLTIVPGNYRADFTYAAKVKVATGAPSGWGAGLVFRYRDQENYYIYRFSSGGLALDKVYRGTKTTLWTRSEIFNTNSWYTLEIVASGSGFTLKRNGTTLTTQTDTAFSLGDLGAISINNAVVSVDDISVTSGSTTTWNFESSTIGTYPDDWRRWTVYDLPSGTGTLTIANYLSEASMKQCTISVSWTSAGAGTKTVTGTTVIGQ